MNKMRVLIADDERPAREFLKELLAGFDQVDLAGEAANGMEAVEMIHELQPDFVLLDLRMPEVSGLEVGRRIGADKMPLVAFVTAHDDQAVSAFELNAIDYLLKPVGRDRLAITLTRAAERLRSGRTLAEEGERLNAAVEMAGDTRPLERIPVRVREDIILVPASEVASIVADGELLHITTAARKRYTINHRLRDIELRLDPERFIRLSRSALVNLDLVDRISPMPGGTFAVFLSNGEEVAASRSQSRLLRARLLKL